LPKQQKIISIAGRCKHMFRVKMQFHEKIEDQDFDPHSYSHIDPKIDAF
jgi:hypothetical protein